MTRPLAVLVGAELRMQLRQPATVLLLLLLVLGAGPLALGAVELYLGALGPDLLAPATGEAAPRRTVRVAVPDEARDWLVEDDRAELVPPERADAVLVLEGGGHATICRGTTARADAAAQRLRQVVARRNRAITAERFAAAGLPIPPLKLLALDQRDVTSAEERRRAQLGTFLPGMMTFVIALVASIAAIELFTGERERGTLETLLSTPVDRRVIVAAKVLVVLGEALLAGVLVPASLGVAAALGLDAAAALDPRAVGVLVAVGLGLAVQAAGVAIVLATVAPTYKAASFLSGPVTIAVLLPAALPFAPVELGLATALVPVGNLALAARDLFAGHLAPAHALAVAVATVGHGALCAAIAVRLLEREGTLFGEDESAALRRAGFHGRDAVALYAVAVAAVWFFGQSAQSLDLVWGMVFTQLVPIGALALLATWWVGLPLAPTLSLRLPTARDALLAGLAGLTAPGIGVLVLLLQEPFLPIPASLAESLARITRVDGPPWLPVLVFALLPALGEELLFRGALLGFLRRSLPVAPRVLLVALLFGAFHLSVHRLLPTAAVGLVPTLAAVRSGSLWTAVIVHFLHNSVLVTVEGGIPGSGPVPVLVAAALALAAFGATAAMRGRG